MKTAIQSKKMRYVVLILVLMTNLLIFFTNTLSFPWNFTSSLNTNLLLGTTSILGILALTFMKKDLSRSDNQIKLAVPLLGILINIIHLLLGASKLKTDLSLLITILLIITAFSISFPRRLSYK